MSQKTKDKDKDKEVAKPAVKPAIRVRHLPSIKPGGYLFIGHSETLNEVTDAVTPVKPAIYRKP